MKTFNVTLTEDQVFNLIKSQNNLVDGYWHYVSPGSYSRTYGITRQSDGGITFFGGNWQILSAEQAFKRILNIQ
jgi:hypothetical protein